MPESKTRKPRCVHNRLLDVSPGEGSSRVCTQQCLDCKKVLHRCSWGKKFIVGQHDTGHPSNIPSPQQRRREGILFCRDCSATLYPNALFGFFR